MLKLKWWIFKQDVFNKMMRKKYCHKGFHKLFKSSIGHGGTNQRMKYIHFLKCRYCNYIFFAKIADKKRYEKMTAKETSAFKEMLSRLKPKQLNKGGCISEEDVSASPLFSDK